MATYSAAQYSSENVEVKKLEYNVFLSSGYIDPNDTEEVIENHKYPHSIFLTARNDETQMLEGSLRVIIDREHSVNELSIPALSSFEVWPWMRGHIKRIAKNHLIQVGSMVIRPEARGGKVLRLLIQQLIELAYHESIRYGISSIDERFYKVLVKMGYPIQQIGDKKYYMGSVTVPVLFDALVLFEQQQHVSISTPAVANTSF